MTDEEYELYCKLLEEAKEAAKNGDTELAKEKLKQANDMLLEADKGNGGSVIH